MIKAIREAVQSARLSKANVEWFPRILEQLSQLFGNRGVDQLLRTFGNS